MNLATQELARGAIFAKLSHAQVQLCSVSSSFGTRREKSPGALNAAKFRARHAKKAVGGVWI